VTARLTPQAARDIDQILEHTLKAFGISQFRRYQSLLNQAIADIAETPLRGGSKKRAELGNNYRHGISNSPANAKAPHPTSPSTTACHQTLPPISQSCVSSTKAWTQNCIWIRRTPKCKVNADRSWLPVIAPTFVIPAKRSAEPESMPHK
jgi:plasmid stabilization system protein ParE